MHFLQAINSDISVLIVCNKTGGTIKGDIKKCNGIYEGTTEGVSQIERPLVNKHNGFKSS